MSSDDVTFGDATTYSVGKFPIVDTAVDSTPMDGADVAFTDIGFSTSAGLSSRLT